MAATRSCAPVADPALLEQAEAAYRFVDVEPARSRDAALAVIAVAGEEDSAAAILALRALGLATRALVGPAAAKSVLRRAVALGERRGPARSLAQAKMTYAALLADLGHTDAALAQCDEAAAILRGKDAGNLLAQRAMILSRAGRSEEALADYAKALPLLRAAGDIAWECRVRMNRSNVLAYLGRPRDAERELWKTIALAEKHGLDNVVAMTRHNLGFVAARRGDIPTALRLFDQPLVGATGYRRMYGMCDRAEALLSVGLAAEARSTLETYAEEAAAAGFAADAAEFLLVLARATLREGDAAAARGLAEHAEAQFRGQRRARWALLARQVVMSARWVGGERTAALARAARDAHARLWTAGWHAAALRCLLIAGRVELDLGRLARARADLAAAARARHVGPADLRAAAWYAEALLRLAGDDKRGANSALRAGSRVVDEHAASFGATDLRVHASGLGAELAGEGVRLAIESGKPVGVLEWIERFRASALRRPPVLPPSDTKLATDLAELRRVTAELADATAAGQDSRALRSERLRLEEAVRQRSRHAAGRRAPAPTLDIGELTEALGGRALVEILRVDDRLFAVTVVERRLRLRALGSYSDALKDQDSLRFSLHRLARRHGSAASLRAAQTALEHAATSLDAALLAPVAAAVGDRELVIVPTGALHALPWATLPSLRGRPIAVAPSATTWLAASHAAGSRPSRKGRVTLVGGPGLEHAHAEIEALAALYAEPTVLAGAAASADAVRSSIEGARLAHIAAHGHFRADNPQFSALELADGPLTVYDLERLRRAPRQLVLSACDSGLSAVRPGDELMGLAAAVFSLGASTLIASVAPVADDVTKALMVELHRELRAGASPSHALASAQRHASGDGFVCFGAA